MQIQRHGDNDVTVVCLCCFWSYFAQLIIHRQDDVFFGAVAIDVFLKLFIIVSTHRQRYVANGT